MNLQELASAFERRRNTLDEAKYGDREMLVNLHNVEGLLIAQLRVNSALEVAFTQVRVARTVADLEALNRLREFTVVFPVSVVPFDAYAPC